MNDTAVTSGAHQVRLTVPDLDQACTLVTATLGFRAVSLAGRVLRQTGNWFTIQPKGSSFA